MHLCKNRLGCSGKNVSPYSKDNELVFNICNDCGLIWRALDSMDITKSYEQTYFDSKKYSKKRKHKVKKSGWLLDLARHYNPNISSLLEIGCSLGYTLEAAKKRSINHLGIDISKYAVEYCNEIGLNAEQFSFDDLLINGKKFDLLFMQHVLEHFKDPFETLKNCYELLHHNGIILILVPNSRYNRAVKYNSKHRFYSIEGVGSEHYIYFNYDNMRAVLRSVGFEVIQENYPFFVQRFETLQYFANRVFRRLMGTFNSDQEILVLAKKTAS